MYKQKHEQIKGSIFTVIESPVFGIGELALVVYTGEEEKRNAKYREELNIIKLKFGCGAHNQGR